MARNDKFKRTAIGHLGKHFERGLGSDNKPVRYSNQSINTDLSHLNYNLAPNRNMSHVEYIKKRTSEVYCLNRKDVNVMSTWVITAPKDIKVDEQRDFFEKTYNFLKNRYGGEKNIVSSYVHMDETTPHMHFAFIPIVKDKKKGYLKVSAKECITRQDLKTFHNDLSKALEVHFKRNIGILNESTRDGNKSIDELKRKSATERIEDINKKSNEMIEEASKIVFKAKEEERGIRGMLVPLKAEYEAIKAFIDQSNIDSDVCVMYPRYAEVIKRGLFKKREFVVVPKEKWEAKHVSANEINAIKEERETLEREINKFKESVSAKKIDSLKKEIKELKEYNNKLYNIIEKERVFVDRVNKVFKESKEFKNIFLKIEKEIKKNRRFSRGR